MHPLEDNSLYRLVLQQYILYYLPPSGITRLLSALKMDPEFIESNSYLMSPEREMFGNYRGLRRLEQSGYNIKYIGHDIQLLYEYVWNPKIKLTRKLNIWICIVNYSDDISQRSCIPYDGCPADIKFTRTKFKNMDLAKYPVDLRGNVKTLYPRIAHGICKCCGRSEYDLPLSNYHIYQNPIGTVVNAYYIIDDLGPLDKATVIYGYYPNVIVHDRSDSIKIGSSDFEKLVIRYIEYSEHSWKINTVCSSDSIIEQFKKNKDYSEKSMYVKTFTRDWKPSDGPMKVPERAVICCIPA